MNLKLHFVFNIVPSSQICTGPIWIKNLEEFSNMGGGICERCISVGGSFAEDENSHFYLVSDNVDALVWKKRG
jgi:hypothetical protein